MVGRYMMPLRPGRISSKRLSVVLVVASMVHCCRRHREGYSSGDTVVAERKDRRENKNRHDLAPNAKPVVLAFSYRPQGQSQQQQKYHPE